jgi:hypothetical protein
MIKRTFAGAVLLVTLLVPGMASAEAPSPDALAIARELVATSGAAENAKQMLPAIVKLIKPAIVQGRPQVEKDFDAITPLLLESFKARLGEMTEMAAVLYATNFTVAEMKDIIAFYRGPTGQKLLTKGTMITQQLMAAGQQLGGQIGRELQSRIVEELKKKGHNI